MLFFTLMEAKMILDFIRDNLNGDTWEMWCDSCYRDRYQNEHFIKVPADHKGDAGIEAFTLSGIVYQCYCPDKEYTVNELYEHLRKKVTTDIGKLIDPKNAPRLKKLGIPPIKEWHFVIPEYPDKRIVEHLEEKRQEVLNTIKGDPTLYSYIDPSIRLIPKVAEDFKVEFVRLIRNPLVDLKLNAAVKQVEPIDWTTCPADKINNIKRKLLAIMKTSEDDDDFHYMVRYWAEAYLQGIEIMNKLHESCGSIYEDLFALEQQHKKDVAAKSRMNPDRSLNHTLFEEVLNQFESSIRNQFKCFSEDTILELRRDLVSGWLADCSLQFKAV